MHIHTIIIRDSYYNFGNGEDNVSYFRKYAHSKVLGRLNDGIIQYFNGYVDVSFIVETQYRVYRLEI